MTRKAKRSTKHRPVEVHVRAKELVTRGGNLYARCVCKKLNPLSMWAAAHLHETIRGTCKACKATLTISP